ncbi:MAG: putative signal transducing protein [Rhodopirellula sp. JB044]|uniref:putative signal transducing protein n=1 Tax=Rhodopirellula sp. JB044 TaxID=3342844 RepID=UPI00370B966C
MIHNQRTKTMNMPADKDDNTLDDANLVTVAERANEISASVLVNILADEGIRAVSVGGFTAGFRAEAPGWVQVKVFEKDSERAKKIIAEVKEANPENE